MDTPRKRVEVGHQQMRPNAHGDPPPPSFREQEAMQIENEAVQNEVREAVQIEAQAGAGS